MLEFTSFALEQLINFVFLVQTKNNTMSFSSEDLHLKLSLQVLCT